MYGSGSAAHFVDAQIVKSIALVVEGGSIK